MGALMFGGGMLAILIAGVALGVWIERADQRLVRELTRERRITGDPFTWG